MLEHMMDSNDHDVAVELSERNVIAHFRAHTVEYPVSEKSFPATLPSDIPAGFAASSLLSSLGYSASSTSKHSSLGRSRIMTSIGVQTETAIVTSRPPLPRENTVTRQPRNVMLASGQRKIHLNSDRRILPTFESTPDSSVAYLICDCLPRINARGTGCCNFQICLARVRAVIRELSARECSQDFLPSSHWQCRSCYCMGDLEDFQDMADMPECSVCSSTDIFVTSPVSDSGCEAGASDSAPSCGTVLEMF